MRYLKVYEHSNESFVNNTTDTKSLQKIVKVLFQLLTEHFAFL